MESLLATVCAHPQVCAHAAFHHGRQPVQVPFARRASVPVTSLLVGCGWIVPRWQQAGSQGACSPLHANLMLPGRMRRPLHTGHALSPDHVHLFAGHHQQLVPCHRLATLGLSAHDPGIISDLFPGIVLPPSDYKLMTAAIEEASAAANLQPTPYFTLKVSAACTDAGAASLCTSLCLRVFQMQQVQVHINSASPHWSQLARFDGCEVHQQSLKGSLAVYLRHP
eukprot:4487-Pelagomonas_calceolata.AAC.1